MKEIWIVVNDYANREKIVTVLAHSGCMVRVVEKHQNNEIGYWVVFQVPENNVK